MGAIITFAFCVDPLGPLYKPRLKTYEQMSN